MSIIYNNNNGVGARGKKSPLVYTDSQEVSWPLSVQSAWRVEKVVRKGKSLNIED
jgi:hypothetical protein